MIDSSSASSSHDRSPLLSTRRCPEAPSESVDAFLDPAGSARSIAARILSFRPGFPVTGVVDAATWARKDLDSTLSGIVTEVELRASLD